MLNEGLIATHTATVSTTHSTNKTNHSPKPKTMKKISTVFLLAVVLCSVSLQAQNYTHFLSRLSGTNRITINNVTYDKLGNVYVCGWYKGSATVNGNTYNSVLGESDGFVAKADTLGNWKWFVPVPENSDNGQAYDVAVDSNYNVFVVAVGDSSTKILGAVPTNGVYGLDDDISLVFFKLSQTGNTPNMQWVKGSQFVTLVNSDHGANVEVDKAQNIFVAAVHQSVGSSSETVSFAGAKFDYDIPNSGFVWKFNTAGSILNKFETTGSCVQLMHDLEIDKNGNVFFTGYGETDANDEIELSASLVIKTVNNRSSYGCPLLVKLNNNLQPQWAKAEWVKYLSYYKNELALDTNGKAYVFVTLSDSVQIGTNYFDANAGYLKQTVLYSYNANGTFNFLKKYSNTGGDIESNSIACDAQNKMVIAAHTYSTVPTFEGVNIGDRPFVARINPSNGNVLTVRTSVNNNISPNTVAVRKNNVLLAGTHDDPDPLQFNNSSLSIAGLASGVGNLGFVVEFGDSALTTGIEETPTLQVKFGVYPNPADAYVNIEIDEHQTGSLQYQIIDITGRIVLSGIADQQLISVNTTSLSRGLYHVILLNSSGKASKRLSIQ